MTARNGTPPPAEVRAAIGPLRVCPENRRYFTDGSGRAVYLTGSHTWNNLVDSGETDPPPAFDFTKYLDFLEEHHHNFIRLWAWEQSTFLIEGEQARRYVEPFPWSRTGPGEALDGKPKFDLSQFDQSYFDRLRSRAEEAGKRHIYVGIMLLEGWGLQFIMPPWGWHGHPFHPSNNINGVDGDPECTGKGLAVHTLMVPDVTRVQEAYVRKVIDTVNDLDNVLYEIANESGPYSTAWQYHLVSYIKGYQALKPKQHPVGMTFQYEGGTNRALYESPADWISPAAEVFDPSITNDPTRDVRAKDDPRPADGKKVIISDTDHIHPADEHTWVWKSFCRGLNPILMDHYLTVMDAEIVAKKRRELARRSMGYTLQLAERMDLVKMKPMGELASSGYCLANPGREYVVYLPEGGRVTVDLSAVSGPLGAEWFDPKSGETEGKVTVSGGGKVDLTAPFAGDAVLCLRDGNGS